MKAFLAVFLFATTAFAADVEVYKTDSQYVTAQGDRDLLVAAIQAHFSSVQLTAAKSFVCSRGTLYGPVYTDTCSIREQGTATSAQFTTAVRAGQDVRAVAIDGSTVTYERNQGPEEITAGAKLDALTAYLQAVHPGPTMQYIAALAVFRVFVDHDADPETANVERIKSVMTYLDAASEDDVAAGVLDKTIDRVVLSSEL